ncbi:hypothetical protein ACSSV4_000596 [Roseovarius sp. MBR-154]|jgi:hypothetical protein
MANALEALKAHYARMRSQKMAVPEITDPETGAPLVVYFDPPTNAQAQMVQARAGGSDGRLTLYTVIYLAKDAEGKRLFEDDAPTVKALSEDVDGGVLARIAARIMGRTSPEDLGN